MRFLNVLLVALLSSFLLACPASTTGPKRNADVVDCNYNWPAKSRHVCIKDMPRADCEALFQSTMFIREESCYCDSAGKQRNSVQGTGYTQYDCN